MEGYLKFLRGNPKFLWGGNPKVEGIPKRGPKSPGLLRGRFLEKRGSQIWDPLNLGAPLFWVPPSHLGPPQIWDPLNLGPLNFWDPLFAPQAKKISHKISGIFLHSEFKSYCNFAPQAKILGVK